MRTIKARITSPGSVSNVGDVILSAAKTMDTKPIKAKLATFAKAHAAFGAADKNVAVAEGLLRDKQAKVAEADGRRDRAAERSLPRWGSGDSAAESTLRRWGSGDPAAESMLRR